MTILAALLLALLALFGLSVNYDDPLPQEVPLEVKEVGVQDNAHRHLVTLDGDSHGHLDWAEGAKLMAEAHGVLQARLGPKYEVTNLATAKGKPLAIAVAVRGGGGYSETTLERLLTSTGVIDLAPMVMDTDLITAGTTLAVETECFEAWRRQHPEAYLYDFNIIHPSDGGPPKGMRWVRSGAESPAYRLVKRPSQASTRFTNTDLTRIRAHLDGNGSPAIAFDVKKARQADFEAYTKSIVGMNMAIIVGEEILTAPMLTSPLRTGAVITGGRTGFAEEEVRDLVIMMSHPLPGIYLRTY